MDTGRTEGGAGNARSHHGGRGGAERYHRHRDIFNPEEKTEVTGKKAKHAPIVIVGAGNIGSNTAYALASMGFENITVYDYDTIEEHNTNTQFFRVADIGAPKVHALADAIAFMRSAQIKPKEQRATGRNLARFAIAIIAVDSLEIRRELADGLMECDKCPRIIDGRMGGSQIEVHTYPDANAWREGIPEEGDEDSCTARFIIYTALGIAALIANTVKRTVNGEQVAKSIIMDYNSQMMITER